MSEELILKTILDEVTADVAPERGSNIDSDQTINLNLIAECACNGKHKAVLAVTMTLLVKKISTPNQDIRQHRSGLPNGFSGRSLDTKVITPFLRKENFPSMASGSGWLTRSLEQDHPYDKNYPGQIKPPELKNAFLDLIDAVERDVDARICLKYLMFKLVEWRSFSASLKLAKPTGKRIAEIVTLIESHWSSNLPGSAKLPVLATYAAYKCLVPEIEKYKNCVLKDLLSHTSADSKSHRLGDIDVRTKNDIPVEAVEVKHNTRISIPIIESVQEKIIGSGLKTFYLLSTDEVISKGDMVRISEIQLDINKRYGCQIIVNGVATTLKYYLRLLANTDTFVYEYVTLVEQDDEIPFELRRNWNILVG